MKLKIESMMAESKEPFYIKSDIKDGELDFIEKTRSSKTISEDYPSQKKDLEADLIFEKYLRDNQDNMVF